MKVTAGLLVAFASAVFVPNPERLPLPSFCPRDVAAEFCYRYCGSLVCWEYPLPVPEMAPLPPRRRREVEALTRSRRGADFTDEHFNCYYTKTVSECNKLYDNDFDPLVDV